MKSTLIHPVMKYTLLLAVLFCLPNLLQSQALTKIFIVRHADRTEGDALSEAGLARAEELKRVLGLSGIQQIFSTNTIRTTTTASPLATLLGLPIKKYTAVPDLIKEIKNGADGGSTLIVGHSDTVDDLISQCGCTPPPAITPNMPATQFDNLFLVILQKKMVKKKVSWLCELTHMKYGAVTN
jgi:broad specificity phosphatase PhoE